MDIKEKLDLNRPAPQPASQAPRCKLARKNNKKGKEFFRFIDVKPSSLSKLLSAPSTSNGVRSVTKFSASSTPNRLVCSGTNPVARRTRSNISLKSISSIHKEAAHMPREGFISIVLLVPQSSARRSLFQGCGRLDSGPDDDLATEDQEGPDILFPSFNEPMKTTLKDIFEIKQQSNNSLWEALIGGHIVTWSMLKYL
eukprot:jgi/Psemu1/3801/gm1.3801_g